MLKTQRNKLRAKGILSIDQLAAIKPNAIPIGAPANNRLNKDPPKAHITHFLYY